jgi:hypothetical protein
MKLRPVNIDANPATKMPSPVVTTLVLEKCVDIGVVKVQPVSTPPVIIAISARVPPAKYMYQLSKLSFGSARSLAPIIIGIRKFPRVAGTDGTKNRKIITIPCILKTLL